jgi:chromate transporter
LFLAEPRRDYTAAVTDHGRTARQDAVPFATATRAWFRVSLQTFGGPAGQIAVMHRMLVDELRWVGERRFLHALNYCMLLPGPEAQQLAIYLGWLLNGTGGGFVAGVLFVLPGFVALMALSAIYAAFGDTVGLEALFAGVAPAVLAIVASAVLRIAGRALGNSALVALAVAAFVALALFRAPFPLVVAAAFGVGLIGQRFRPDLFVTGGHGGAPDGPAPVIADDALHGAAPSWGRAARILAIGAAAWAGPLLVLWAVFGSDSIYLDQGLFFSGTAVVTFGAPTPSSRTSRSERSTATAGCSQARWCGASPWPRRRRDRSSRWCSSWPSSAPTGTPGRSVPGSVRFSPPASSPG